MRDDRGDKEKEEIYKRLLDMRFSVTKSHNVHRRNDSALADVLLHDISKELNAIKHQSLEEARQSIKNLEDQYNKFLVQVQTQNSSLNAETKPEMTRKQLEAKVEEFIRRVESLPSKSRMEMLRISELLQTVLRAFQSYIDKKTDTHAVLQSLYAGELAYAEIIETRKQKVHATSKQTPQTPIAPYPPRAVPNNLIELQKNTENSLKRFEAEITEFAKLNLTEEQQNRLHRFREAITEIRSNNNALTDVTKSVTQEDLNKIQNGLSQVYAALNGFSKIISEKAQVQEPSQTQTKSPNEIRTSTVNGTMFANSEVSKIKKPYKTSTEIVAEYRKDQSPEGQHNYRLQALDLMRAILSSSDYWKEQATFRSMPLGVQDLIKLFEAMDTRELGTSTSIKMSEKSCQEAREAVQDRSRDNESMQAKLYDAIDMTATNPKEAVEKLKGILEKVNPDLYNEKFMEKETISTLKR